MNKITCKCSYLVTFIFLCLIGGTNANDKDSCPCQNIQDCSPIDTNQDREIFIFSTTYKNWPFYDWSKITTVVKFGELDANWTCLAHSKGSKVSFGTNIPIAQMRNATARSLWVEEQARKFQENIMDGVNVDFEEHISPQDNETREDYNKLISELTSAIRRVHPQAQITIDVPWWPKSNAFDYKSLSELSDFLFVMDYDTNCDSQPQPPCIAGANSPANRTVIGATYFREEMGVPYDKMVLGLPWYGYNYPCLKFNKNSSGGPGTCYISPIKSRCTDAAGTQISFGEIMEKYVARDPHGPRLDRNTWSMFLEYKQNSTMYQLWYDNPLTLKVKNRVAEILNLRGLGMWEADLINYANKEQTAAMWNTFPQWKTRKSN